MKKFSVESIVREEGRGIEILRLPPYHCKCLMIGNFRESSFYGLKKLVFPVSRNFSTRLTWSQSQEIDST